MAILITGGAGFVGLNVAEHLLKRGDDVVIFGPAPPPSAALAALRNQPGRLTCHSGDVSSAADLDGAFAANAIDRVIHGAAITAGLDRERTAARSIFTVNLLGTIELLEAALRHRVGRVVQLGTGSIFGTAGAHSATLDEQTSPVLPETLYGISKFAAERTGLRYRQTRALNLTVVRLGAVFGRWEYDTGVRDSQSLALQLYRSAEAGQQAVIPAITADDWVYATDVARGLAAVLDRYDAPEPIYHLSAGKRWPVSGWCERLKGHFPGFSYRISERLQECTVGRTQARPRSPMNIQRIRRDVGYEPIFDLDDAFSDYVEWASRIALVK